MFENYAKFRVVVVTGPQRSGTRIASQMIVHDTGHAYFDEDDYGVKDVSAWMSLVLGGNNLVIHSPAMARYLDRLPENMTDVLIVWMDRMVADIIQSQNRIGWDREEDERVKYEDQDAVSTDGPIAEVKTKYWVAVQRDRFSHWTQIDYRSLADHPLWVPDEYRADFGPTQTSFVSVQRSEEEWNALEKKVSAGYVPTGGGLYRSGQRYVENFIAPLGFIDDFDRVVEIGCGNGRIAMGLVDYKIQYHGFDIIPGSIRFCREVFFPFPHFKFSVLPVDNGHYYAKHGTAANEMELPIDDASVDVVLAVSLFTHINRPSAIQRYLQETMRVLKPGGFFYSTWLKSPPNEVSEKEARTVYLEENIRWYLEEWEWIEDQGGDETERKDRNQWRILLRKPA